MPKKKVWSPIILSRFYSSITSGGEIKLMSQFVDFRGMYCYFGKKRILKNIHNFRFPENADGFFFAYKEYFFRDLVRPRKGIPKRKKEKKQKNGGHPFRLGLNFHWNFHRYLPKKGDGEKTQLSFRKRRRRRRRREKLQCITLEKCPWLGLRKKCFTQHPGGAFLPIPPPPR